MARPISRKRLARRNAVDPFAYSSLQGLPHCWPYQLQDILSAFKSEKVAKEAWLEVRDQPEYNRWRLPTTDPNFQAGVRPAAFWLFELGVKLCRGWTRRGAPVPQWLFLSKLGQLTPAEKEALKPEIKLFKAKLAAWRDRRRKKLQALKLSSQEN